MGLLDKAKDALGLNRQSEPVERGEDIVATEEESSPAGVVPTSAPEQTEEEVPEVPAENPAPVDNTVADAGLPSEEDAPVVSPGSSMDTGVVKEVAEETEDKGVL